MTKAQEAWERAAKYSERAQVTTDEETRSYLLAFETDGSKLLTALKWPGCMTLWVYPRTLPLKKAKACRDKGR